MIRLLNIREIGKYPLDETWVIVRSLKSPIKNTVQVKELSPSYELFIQYRQLAEQNNWNRQTFDEIYVPQFIREMQNPIARERLNELYLKEKQGLSIGLACFCTDETMCHRSIVGGLLSGAGANVVTSTGNDYSHYYENYKEIKNTTELGF